MNLISYIRDGEKAGALMQRTRQYWKSAPSERTPEILLHGQVRVCKNLRELGIEQIIPIQDASVDALMRESRGASRASILKAFRVTTGIFLTQQFLKGFT